MELLTGKTGSEKDWISIPVDILGEKDPELLLAFVETRSSFFKTRRSFWLSLMGLLVLLPYFFCAEKV